MPVNIVSLKERKRFLSLLEHHVHLMSVALVLWREVHIVPIGNATELIKVSRAFKGITFKDKVLMRHHTAAWVLLVEPGSV